MVQSTLGMSPQTSLRTLLEAGVHFGHQTKRWNPKMKPYIFTERNGIHIIDLQQTVKQLEDAAQLRGRSHRPRRQGPLRRHQEAGAGSRRATKPTAAASSTSTDRWLGGTLTNFITIRQRLRLLKRSPEAVGRR